MIRACREAELGVREKTGRLSEGSLTAHGEKHWIRSRTCEDRGKKTLTANASND